jgi:hypothetical protein
VRFVRRSPCGTTVPLSSVLEKIRNKRRARAALRWTASFDQREGVGKSRELVNSGELHAADGCNVR